MQFAVTPAISLMTLSYDAVEDRVIFACEIEPDGKLLLQCTRRLLNHLVPHLIHAQSNHAEGPNELSGFSNENHTPPKLNEHAAVIPDSSTESLLVTSVDFSSTADHIVLAWKDKDEVSRARLVLTFQSLPSWLDALQQCYVAGSWSTEVWTGVSLQEKFEGEGQPFTVH